MSVKSDAEKTVLEYFLNACPIFSGKVSDTKPCNPPEPDCICEFKDGSRRYFELSEIVDEGIAEKFYGRKVDPSGGFFDDDILNDRVREKLEKKYQTNGLDIELLLYFSFQPMWPEETMTQQVRDVVNSRGRGPFKRVWLFSVPKTKVMGSFWSSYGYLDRTS